MAAAWRTRALYAAPFIAAMMLALWTPTEEGPTICPFALATGTACPGCGMTRAIGFLSRGDFSAAFALHPLVMLISIQAVAGWGWLVLRRAEAVRPLSNRLVSAILVGTGVSLLAVWVIRALAGTLPPV